MGVADTICRYANADVRMNLALDQFSSRGPGGVGGFLHESDILRFCVEQVCGATEVKFAWDGYEVRDGDRRNGVHVGSW
jgi:hypothetical protein